MTRLSACTTLLTALLATGWMGSAAAPFDTAPFDTAPGETQTAEDTAAARRFVGMWRLVSWNQRLADGTSRPAQTDQGYLVYADVGRMCAVIMDSRRPKWEAQPPATVTDAMTRFSGFISYCARVEVNAAEGYVLHHVDIERNPGTVGAVRKRWFTFDGPDRLSLRIDRQELQGSLAESILVWERVKAPSR